MNLPNLFVSTTFAPDNSRIEEVLALCQKADITAIELGSNHRHESDPLSIVKKYDFRFLVHNYFPTPEESLIVNIASLNDTIYSRSLKHIKDAITFCSLSGAMLYTFHPGFLTDPSGASINASSYDFHFDEERLNSANYRVAFDRLISAVREIVDFASARCVNIAIETEGSYRKKNHLLMQLPSEYKEFFSFFSPNEIGVNLNIGHLHLAASAFGFEKDEFINIIANHVVAMELSHNDGIDDQHLPLVSDAWYWNTIMDQRFNRAFKILEFRNISIDSVLRNMELLIERGKQ